MMDNSLVLDIFRNQLEQHAVVHSGNYNPQDSTSFKNMYAFVELTVKIGRDTEDGPGETEQQVWKLTLNNNTWGEDFKIQNFTTRHLKHQIIEGYFCDEPSHNRNLNLCVEYITEVLTAGRWFKHEKEALTSVDVLQGIREQEADFIKYYESGEDKFDNSNF